MSRKKKRGQFKKSAVKAVCQSLRKGDTLGTFITKTGEDKQVALAILTLKDKPIVYITPEAKRRLDAYIKLAEGEISGLGEVEQTPDGNFVITKLILFEQTCTGASTKLSPDDLGSFFTQAIRDGLEVERLKVWWHSHVDMGAFWSSQDVSTMEGFNNGEWLISIVGNRRGERLVRLDLYSPIKGHIDDLQLVILPQDNEELEQEIQAEIDAKVTYQKSAQKRPNQVSSFARTHQYQGRLVNQYGQPVFPQVNTSDFDRFVRVDGDWRLRREFVEPEVQEVADQIVVAEVSENLAGEDPDQSAMNLIDRIKKQGTTEGEI